MPDCGLVDKGPKRQLGTLRGALGDKKEAILKKAAYDSGARLTFKARRKMVTKISCAWI